MEQHSKLDMKDLCYRAFQVEPQKCSEVEKISDADKERTNPL